MPDHSNGPKLTDYLETLLTVEEVAEKLSVAPNTVRRWLRNKWVAGFKLRGGPWRVPTSELRRFVEEGNPDEVRGTWLTTAEREAEAVPDEEG